MPSGFDSAELPVEFADLFFESVPQAGNVELRHLDLPVGVSVVSERV